MSSVDLFEIVIVSMALVTERALYRVVPGKEPWVQIPGYSIHLTIYRVQITGYSHSPKMYIQDMSLVFPLGGEVLPTVFTGVGLVGENN